MRFWFRCGLMALICGVALAGAPRADEPTADAGDNAVVTDGPSRGEIFEARVRAELGPMGALSAAAAPPYFLPTDVKGDLVLGIDVSHHNDENCKCKPGQDCSDCKIDWNRIRDQKVSFVYLKASQGTKYRDPTFDYHWRTLAQKNIPRGAYHFMSADEDPIVQAENFLDKMEQDGKLQPVDLPPCLDLESDMRKDNSKRWFVSPDSGEIRDFWLGQNPDEIISKVLKWLKHVEEKTGRIPIVYTSRGWWNDRIKDEKKFAQLSRYPIWIANYPGSGSHVNAQPKVPNGHAWALWQFTETGRVKDTDILPGKVDVNLFNGSLGSFEQALGVAVPEKTEIARIDVPAEPSKPSEQATDATPAAPTDAGKPPEQKDPGKPPEPVASTNPTEPREPPKPAEPVVAANPPEPQDTSKPPEPATENPGATKEATKPTEQVAILNPSAPNDTAAPVQSPAQPVTGANQSAPAGANKPTELPTGAVPSNTKPNAAASNPKAAPSPKSARTQLASAQKTTVEIVLVNGRVLRVDANIDPAVLTRIITAVDGN